jgi:hypothetical protein
MNPGLQKGSQMTVTSIRTSRPDSRLLVAALIAFLLPGAASAAQPTYPTSQAAADAFAAAVAK